MSLSFFLLCLPVVFFGDDTTLTDKLSDPTPLKSRVLIAETELDLYVARLERFGDRGLILFALQDKLIKYFDFQSGKLELFAREGRGPGEFRGGFLYGSVIGGEVVVKEWETAYLKAFSMDGSSRIVSRIGWSIRSLVPVNDRFVIGVIATPGGDFFGADMVQGKVPKDSLVLFETGKKNEPWQLHGSFFDRDLADDLDFDSYFSTKMDLFLIRDSGLFYRVPYFGSPNLQVMNVSGEVVRDIPLPHPFAAELPEDVNARLYLKKSGKNLRYIADACVDHLGNLHVLLANIRDAEENFSQRLGIVIDEFGNTKGSFVLDRPVKRLVISVDGTSYYGIDGREDALLAFAIPPQ